MAASGGDLERPLGHGLADDIGEIHRIGRGTPRRGPLDRGRCELVPAEGVDQSRQRRHGDNARHRMSLARLAMRWSQNYDGRP